LTYPGNSSFLEGDSDDRQTGFACYLRFYSRVRNRNSCTARRCNLRLPGNCSNECVNKCPALDDLYSGASDATASNRLGELVTDLHKTGMKPAFIVDHLIGAYCPLVAADDTLSDKQKAVRVRQFARRVTELAYVPADPDEVEVLVTVPLAPTLLGQVDLAASRSGLSRNAWLERAIKQQLTVP
jgi:hypothetical protein